jgi:phosphatidylinositol 4-kinase
LKEKFDRIEKSIIKSLDEKDKEFYEREFDFFNRITTISGKLIPFIRKTKLEKKEKIMEELKAVKVVPGVYLPSDPSSVVIDIDYNSGTPLQSHAKAPFMATFKIKRKIDKVSSKRKSSYESLFNPDDEELVSGNEKEEILSLSAIFKVGDDCRQDVLALQLIAMFNNIFKCFGLKLFLYPYRIVASGPGCGVIEVVPNSMSRDEIGRKSVNDLLR